MKHELHGDATERCLRKAAERNNNKCIREAWRKRCLFTAGIVESLHCEKCINALEFKGIL